MCEQRAGNPKLQRSVRDKQQEGISTVLSPKEQAEQCGLSRGGVAPRTDLLLIQERGRERGVGDRFSNLPSIFQSRIGKTSLQPEDKEAQVSWCLVETS